MRALVSPFGSSTDLRLRLIGPFVLFLTGMMFFRLKMYLDIEASLIVNQVGIALAAGFIGWELSRFSALWIQKKLPGLKRIRSRILWLCLALIIVSHIGYVVRVWFHFLLDGDQWLWPTLLDYSDTTGVVIFYTSFTLSIYESGYLFSQWKKTTSEKETLIQNAWQAKYDLLKAQINPHFLFNSLNSLSSLISEDPVTAEKFADEMSRVYRYLLRTSEQELVSLAAELDFIKSYCHLLQVRHGTAFQYSVDVEPKFQDFLVPALTLQLLVENAVKHNVVSREAPLRVCICVIGTEKLIVRNNLQKKKVTIPTSGMGLTNIKTRYRLLNLEPVNVVETQHEFTVSIPLIKNSVEEFSLVN